MAVWSEVGLTLEENDTKLEALEEGCKCPEKPVVFKKYVNALMNGEEEDHIKVMGDGMGH